MHDASSIHDQEKTCSLDVSVLLVRIRECLTVKEQPFVYERKEKKINKLIRTPNSSRCPGQRFARAAQLVAAGVELALHNSPLNPITLLAHTMKDSVPSRDDRSGSCS